MTTEKDFFSVLESTFTSRLEREGFNDHNVFRPVRVAIMTCAPTVSTDGQPYFHQWTQALYRGDADVAAVSALNGVPSGALHQWTAQINGQTFPYALVASSTKELVIINAFVSGLNGNCASDVTPGVPTPEGEAQAKRWVRFVLQQLEGCTGKRPIAVLFAPEPSEPGKAPAGQYLPPSPSKRDREVRQALAELGVLKEGNKGILLREATTQALVVCDLPTEESFYESVGALPATKRDSKPKYPPQLFFEESEKRKKAPAKAFRQFVWNLECKSTPAAESAEATAADSNQQQQTETKEEPKEKEKEETNQQQPAAEKEAEPQPADTEKKEESKSGEPEAVSEQPQKEDASTNDQTQPKEGEQGQSTGEASPAQSEAAEESKPQTQPEPEAEAGSAPATETPPQTEKPPEEANTPAEAPSQSEPQAVTSPESEYATAVKLVLAIPQQDLVSLSQLQVAPLSKQETEEGKSPAAGMATKIFDLLNLIFGVSTERGWPAALVFLSDPQKLLLDPIDQYNPKSLTPAVRRRVGTLILDQSFTVEDCAAIHSTAVFGPLCRWIRCLYTLTETPAAKE